LRIISTIFVAIRYHYLVKDASTISCLKFLETYVFIIILLIYVPTISKIKVAEIASEIRI